MKKNEWKIKYWCAKEFGWEPKQVENMSAWEIKALVDMHNLEAKEMQRNLNKGNKRNIYTGTNYG